MAEFVVTTPTTRDWLRADGLLQSEALPGAGQTLADAQGSVAAYAALGGALPAAGGPAGGGRPMERAAREYYAGPELAAVVSAAALLVGSPVGRVIGTFFLRIAKPAAPIRIFTDKREALAWLEAFRE